MKPPLVKVLLELWPKKQLRNSMQIGKFIVLDGNDGSGKATQTKLLAEYLSTSGIPYEKFDFPSYDKNFFGELIGECLAGKHGDFVHLDPKIASPLYALDRLETAPKIRNALEAGKIVLADRYASSNQIHQGGKIKDTNEREEFMQWLEKMEYEIVGIPRPDAVVYLDVPVEVSLELLTNKRAQKNAQLGGAELDTVEEDRQYLENSHTTARWLAEHENNWHFVTCMGEGELRSREEIHADVLKIFIRLSSKD